MDRLGGGGARTLPSSGRNFSPVTARVRGPDGEEWVLKRLTAGVLSLAAQARLRRDVDLLVAAGPLAGAPRLDREGDDLVLARPFLTGVTLRERLSRGALPIADALAAALALFSALDRVHARGCLHRNLKPSNVVFDGDKAQLVDFFVTRHAWLQGSLSELPVDAVRYLAPESAGLIDRNVDASADLYAAGATLYEMLTGRPLFPGETVGELLRQHLTARPRPLIGVPRALALMVDRLLHKEPRDRYQTAAGVRADLEALIAARAQGDENPDLAIGFHDRRSTLTDPIFVGRTTELAQLGEALGRARAGHGGLILLEGDSGSGKTWLLEELLRRANAEGARVLRGRALDQGAKRPLQLAADLAQDIVALLREDSDQISAVAARLGDLSPAVCAALPELGAVLRSSALDGDRTLVPDLNGEGRSLAALAALLDALGSAERPALVVLDDGQWGDATTLRVLARWQAQRAAARHTTVVLAFRSDAARYDHPLAILLAPAGEDAPRPLWLRLGLLESGDVSRLLTSMAGPLPRDTIELVARYAEGNPFLAGASLHGLVERGVLEATDHGWRVDARFDAELHDSPRTGSVLAARLSRLSRDARKLLRVGAVIGKSFDPLLAGAVHGIDSEAALRLVEACPRGILWPSAGGAEYAFLHDQIREALLAALGPEERARLHLRIAEQLEQSPQRAERSFELAFHFDAAGQAARALPHALAAADRARAQFDLDLAESHYRLAMRGVSPDDRVRRYRIEKGLGEILTLRGHYAAAVLHLETALTLASDAHGRAEVEERRAQLELKRGDLRAACDHGEAALRHVGRWVPRSITSCAAATLGEFGVQVLRNYVPALVPRRRDDGPGVEAERFAIRLYHAMNAPYFFSSSRGPVWATWAHLRCLNLAQAYPDGIDLARACAVHGSVVSAFPMYYERGIEVTRRGVELSERLGDTVGLAEGLTFHSLVLHVAQRHEEAIAAGRRGAALFDRTGDRWKANSGLCLVGLSQLRLGRLHEAVETARDLHARASAIDDVHGLAWSLDIWSRASGGEVPAALLKRELRRSRDHVQTFLIVSQAEAARLLGANAIDEAIVVLEEALRIHKAEVGLFYDLNVSLLAYLATAMRRRAALPRPYDPRTTAEHVRAAARAVQRAIKMARRFRNSLPQALREGAYVAAMRGDRRAARALIEESLETARIQGARYEEALSQIARGEIGADLGWPIDAAELDGAHAAARAMDMAARIAARDGEGERGDAPPEARGAVTLSLLDRYANVLEAGHRIAVALTADAVYRELHAAALALLRGEHCVILRGAIAEGVKPVYGAAGTTLSASLLATCYRAREVTVLPSPDEPLQRAGVRSVLCAPILVRNEVFGCMYLTHSSVVELFGEEEQRIAQFLATLAGAALENAEGFAEIQALSRELDARVKQRTAELGHTNQELEANLRRLRDAQEQLIQTGKMAAVGGLAAGLSHELNNPLGVIVGYAQVLLRQTAPGAPMHGPLVAIERQAQRCKRLVRALLDVARHKPAERSALSPLAVCRSVVELASAQAQERGVQIGVLGDEADVPQIAASLEELESALLNLLSNALDATPAGGRVTVEARAQQRGGRAGVSLSVKDEGPGLSEEVKARMFDPFFTTKPVGKGTGLGLAITRQIIISHEGQIDVDSDPTAGTCVQIWLPVAQ